MIKKKRLENNIFLFKILKIQIFFSLWILFITFNFTWNKKIKELTATFYLTILRICINNLILAILFLSCDSEFIGVKIVFLSHNFSS